MEMGKVHLMPLPTQHESLCMLVDGCRDGDISRDDLMNHALMLGCSDRAIAKALCEVDGAPTVDKLRYWLY